MLNDRNYDMDALKNAVIYLRASTNEKLQANSLEVQRAIVTAFAGRSGYTIVKEFVEYASGTNDERAEFNKAIQMAEATGCTIISWRVDRLSRSLTVFAKINHMLPQLRFAELGDTEPNLMVMSVLIAAGQNEVANTRIRIKETFRILKEKDGRTWGNPNILTDAQPEGLKVRKQNAAKFNARIQDIVVNLRSCGYNLNQCVTQLNEQLQITTRRGSLWSRQSLARVLAY